MPFLSPPPILAADGGEEGGRDLNQAEIKKKVNWEKEDRYPPRQRARFPDV
jgi:hypothetical protein